MLRKFLFWLSGRLPFYDNKNVSDYLERYYLGSFFNLRFYLHRFVAISPKGFFHNHIWINGFSTMLSGFYIQESLDGSFERVYYWNYLKGTKHHRIDKLSKPDCWTLFIHGGYGTHRFEFRDTGTGRIQYSPVESSVRNHKWWLTAPLGKDTNRVPLRN